MIVALDMYSGEVRRTVIMLKKDKPVAMLLDTAKDTLFAGIYLFVFHFLYLLKSLLYINIQFRIATKDLLWCFKATTSQELWRAKLPKMGSSFPHSLVFIDVRINSYFLFVAKN